MSRPQVIQLTLESMADWNVDIADIIEPYINKLEQENKELKAALLKFIQLDPHDPDLKDDLWCLQQEESPLIDPDSVYRQMAEHDAELILQTFKDAYKAGFDHGLQSDKNEIEKLNGTSDSIGMFDYYFEQHIKGIALIYIHQKAQESDNEMDT